MQKMNTNNFKNFNFIWAMRRLDMHLIWPNFFSFLALGKVSRKDFLLTAIWSYQIPKEFPKMFSIAPHFYPICFPQNYPHFTCIDPPSLLETSILRSLQSCFFFVFFGWPNQNGLLQKKKIVELEKHFIIHYYFNN